MTRRAAQLTILPTLHAQVGLTMCVWPGWTDADSLYRLGVHFAVAVLLVPNYPAARPCKPLTAIRHRLQLLTGESFALHRCAGLRRRHNIPQVRRPRALPGVALLAAVRGA